MDIKLSVDGQDGEVLARDSGLLQAPEAIDQALVPVSVLPCLKLRQSHLKPPCIKPSPFIYSLETLQ
jgi:hypothetical protein